MEVTALRLFAPRGNEKIDMRLGLNAFCNDLDLERMGQIDRRPNNCRAPPIGRDRVSQPERS